MILTGLALSSVLFVRWHFIASVMVAVNVVLGSVTCTLKETHPVPPSSVGLVFVSEVIVAVCVLLFLSLVKTTVNGSCSSRPETHA